MMSVVENVNVSTVNYGNQSWFAWNHTNFTREDISTHLGEWQNQLWIKKCKRPNNVNILLSIDTTINFAYNIVSTKDSNRSVVFLRCVLLFTATDNAVNNETRV